MADKKPNYHPWNEEEFNGDTDVQMMTPVQRWMYRTLLQKCFFASTRPYLPNDEKYLWFLAGCESKQQWEENKEPVIAKFSVVEGHPDLLEHNRVVKDWNKLIEAREKMAALSQKAAVVRQTLAGGTARPPDDNRTATVLIPGGNRTISRGIGRVTDKDTDTGKDTGTNTTERVGVSDEGGQAKTTLGSWKNIALRHKRFFGTQASTTHKEKYAQYCSKYGEEVVLACFDDWAPDAKDWVESSAVKQPLFAFWKKLPEMAEVQVEIVEAEKQEAANVAAEEEARQKNAAAVETSVRQQMTEHAEFMEYKHPLRDAGEDPEEAMKG